MIRLADLQVDFISFLFILFLLSQILRAGQKICVKENRQDLEKKVNEEIKPEIYGRLKEWTSFYNVN